MCRVWAFVKVWHVYVFCYVDVLILMPFVFNGAHITSVFE